MRWESPASMRPLTCPNARWVCFTSIRNKPACQTRHKAWSRLWSH